MPKLTKNNNGTLLLLSSMDELGEGDGGGEAFVNLLQKSYLKGNEEGKKFF